MTTQNNLIDDSVDKKYLARCLRQLKEWNAPINGWYCTAVVDVREDDPDAPLSECELCGCTNVRYEHIMENDQYFEPITVGCICAGILEGDIPAAKERERLMRNRSKRKRNFISREWKKPRWNIYNRTYRKQDIAIYENSGSYVVRVCGKTVATYKNKPITDFLSACYAAFDIADPISEVMKCAKR